MGRSHWQLKLQSDSHHDIVREVEQTSRVCNAECDGDIHQWYSQYQHWVSRQETTAYAIATQLRLKQCLCHGSGMHGQHTSQACTAPNMGRLMVGV